MGEKWTIFRGCGKRL